jgi:hypothetical protein
VTVVARRAGTSTWLSLTTATYTYNEAQCTSTSITTVPDSVENLVVFAGFKLNSLQKYTFNDTVSKLNSLNTDSSDFCGEKILTF